MSWEKVKLGDVVTITKGKKHIETNDVSAQRYLQIEDLNGHFTKKYTYENGTIVNEQDIVIAWDGANAGKVGCGFNGVIGSTLARLRLTQTNLNTVYVKRYLDFKLDYIKAQRTGATIPHVSGQALRDMVIPLPPLPNQQKIAAILDAADNLRRKDKELLAKYESLLQSIFYHLFGNPLKNEKGWDIALLSNVVDTRLGKMLDAKKINGKHLYKYLGNSNVLWNEFDLNDLKEMDFSSEERQVFNLRRGDILMCEGGEVGRCAIWETDDADIYFQKALHRIRVKKEKLNEHFFVWLMFIMSKNNGFKDYVSSATIAHLTGAKLKTMKLVLPPIKLQNHFASIAHNIKLQKKQVIEQSSQSEALFQKLLQKAFKGELVS